MRILTRYLLRAHIGPFFFSLSVLTGVLLINTVAKRFEELAGKGLPIGVILEVFALSIPYTLALTLPMSVLVAVLYVFSQMTAENEITALKASGVSLVRAIAPLVVTGILLTGGMVWFNDAILPEANHALKNLLLDIARKSPTLELREQVINPIRTQDARSHYFLQAARIDAGTNRLFDVVIYDLSAAQRERTIYADSGRMALTPDQTDIYLTLHDGWIHEWDREQPARFVRIFYDEQVIRFAGVGNVLERNQSAHRGDREMSIGMLWAEIEKGRAELAEIRNEARDRLRKDVEGLLALGDDGKGEERLIPRRRGDQDHFAYEAISALQSYKERAKTVQQRINRFEVELHKKFAIPFACIVFVLIGGPLAARFPRGGVGMVIAFSLLIFSIYWVGLHGGEQLGDKGIVSPAWGMWVTNVVFLSLGIFAMTRFGRERSTARGNPWDDLRDRLRRVIPLRRAALRRGEAR